MNNPNDKLKGRIDEIAESLVNSGSYSPDEAQQYSALMKAMHDTTDPRVIEILGKQIAQLSAKLNPDQWVIDLIMSGELHKIRELLDNNIDPSSLN